MISITTSSSIRVNPRLAVDGSDPSHGSVSAESPLAEPIDARGDEFRVVAASSSDGEWTNGE